MFDEIRATVQIGIRPANGNSPKAEPERQQKNNDDDFRFA